MGRARAVGIIGLGLLAGGVVGATAALLLAPRAGRETRAQVRKAADEAREKIRGTLGEGRRAVQESRIALRRAFDAGRGVLRGSRQEVETVARIT